MIELAQLEQMFDGMRSQTPLNVDGPMLWGYFFTDKDRNKLLGAATHLAGQGYRFVGIHETGSETTNVLHIERVETHSPKTLFTRNEELYRLAAQLGLDSYDGVDVG